MSMAGGRKKKPVSLFETDQTVDDLAEKCLSRAWAVFNTSTFAIACLILTIRASSMDTVWQRTQCPRVGIRDGVYGVLCGSTTDSDGRLPLAAFPLAAAYIGLVWSILSAVSWRYNFCDKVPVLQGSPQSLCSTIIFPLLLPPIVYFGIQPCLTTIVTFCFIEAILRWIWYAAKYNASFKTSMVYVIGGNITKFAIIYSYISYAEVLQASVKAYLIVDLIFTIARAMVAIIMGRPSDEKLVVAEWVSTILQLLQFFVMCLISGLIPSANI